MSICHRAATIGDCSALMDLMIKKLYPVVSSSKDKINFESKLRLLESEVKKPSKVIIVANRENELGKEEKLVRAVEVSLYHYANILFSTRELPGELTFYFIFFHNFLFLFVYLLIVCSLLF